MPKIADYVLQCNECIAIADKHGKEERKQIYLDRIGNAASFTKPGCPGCDVIDAKFYKYAFAPFHRA